MPTPELYGPMTATASPWSTVCCATVLPVAGSALSSTGMMLICLPSTPPLAFTSSAASVTPFSMSWPLAA